MQINIKLGKCYILDVFESYYIFIIFYKIYQEMCKLLRSSLSFLRIVYLHHTKFFRNGQVL